MALHLMRALTALSPLLTPVEKQKVKVKEGLHRSRRLRPVCPHPEGSIGGRAYIRGDRGAAVAYQRPLLFLSLPRVVFLAILRLDMVVQNVLCAGTTFSTVSWCLLGTPPLRLTAVLHRASHRLSRLSC